MTKRSKRGNGKPGRQISKRGHANAQNGPVLRSVGEGGTRNTHHAPRDPHPPPRISSPAPRTTSPVQVLELAIATRRKSQTELSGLAKWLADKSADLAALEKTGDLHDPEVLTELVHLQISIGLLPRRIAVKEECDANAAQALIHATNQFIREHLGPRVRRLAEQTRAMVERELSLHYRAAAALIVAVAQSEQVRYIDSLSGTVTQQPPRGALVHAEDALQSWASADKFETTHLTEPQINPNNGHHP
jgi:hypothetical protein